MIDILVPVLGRPQAIDPLVYSIRISTDVAHTILFLCSPGDEEAIEACHDSAERFCIVTWEPTGGDWQLKINLGYRMTKNPFLLLGASDLRFHPGWDLHALAVAEQTGAGVIGTNDLGNKTVMSGRHSTHPLVRRAYIEVYGTIDEPGKVLHEGYAHQWCDTELVETAKMRRQWAFAADSHVEHLHPFWKKGEMDVTYEKALSTSKEDYRLYQRRRLLWSRRALRKHEATA